MSTEDFDLPQLAIYLHLDPQQVMRLADRGKLPGRKVGGQWRFTQAEVHHWLENRIGLSDEEQLVQVEHVLSHGGPSEEEAISIAQMLPREAIAIPLARTRDSVIRSMVELAAATGWLWDPEKMADAVRSREALHSTALENGVALLHARRPMANILGQAFLALGITAGGIPFGAGMPLSDIFFLICSVEDRGHLRTLARLSRLLTVAGFLDALRAVPHAAAARQLIVDIESKL